MKTYVAEEYQVTHLVGTEEMGLRPSSKREKVKFITSPFWFSSFSLRGGCKKGRGRGRRGGEKSEKGKRESLTTPARQPIKSRY